MTRFCSSPTAATTDSKVLSTCLLGDAEDVSKLNKPERGEFGAR